MLFTKNNRSIRSIWESQLRSVLDSDLISCGRTPSGRIPFASTEGIPISRCRDIRQIAYRSAIALQLAPKLGISPLDLAREWVARLPETEDFAVSVTHPGWIDCQLTDVGLARWLQQWTRCPDSTPNTRVPPPANPFPLQYAHARCCSLLRLAEDEGLIDLRMGRDDIEIVAPAPLPWLDDTCALRLQHPAERVLIGQSIAIVDALENLDEILSKQAMKLGAAFEGFYSQCRILGEVKTRDPALAQARSGLVTVTQTVLKSLLEDHFGLPAPMEL